MEVRYEHCAGLDVHRNIVVACVPSTAPARNTLSRPLASAISKSATEVAIERQALRQLRRLGYGVSLTPQGQAA